MKSKRKHKSHRKFSPKLFKFIFPIILLGALLLTLNNSPVFTAKRIECYTQFGTCSANYLNQVEWLIGRPMFSRLPATQVKKQLGAYPEVHSVSLFRRLPSTLVVSMTLRKPLGALGPDVLGAQVISDEYGTIYKQLDQTNLPLLFTEGLPSSNDILSQNQVKSLKILENLTSLSDYRLTARLSGSTLTVNFQPNLELIIDVNRDLDKWYPSLQLILARSKITAKMPRKIDLRFDNSVIVN